MTPATLDTLNLSFPPLPQTLLRALELTHEAEGPALEDVAEMVEHDPAAAARLLRVANSAYYGQNGRIHDVERAVTVLGAAPVVGLIMSMGVAELRDAIDERMACPFLNLIRHSIATGFLARHLIQRAPDAAATAGKGGEAFAAGLLHDIGKLALLYNFPDEMVVLYEEEAASEEALCSAEKQRVGCDHWEAGLHFARRFRLPASLRQVLSANVDTEDDLLPDVPLLAAITAADAAANVLDHAFNPVHGQAEALSACSTEAAALGFGSTDEMAAVLQEAEDDMAGYVGAVL